MTQSSSTARNLEKLWISELKRKITEQNFKKWRKKANSDEKNHDDIHYLKTFYIWPIVVQRCTNFVLNSWRFLYILNYFIIRCHSNLAILATDLASSREISFEVQVSFPDHMLSVVSPSVSPSLCPSVWPPACLYTSHFWLPL